MKVSIRRGVFETNSSTVHSITMCKASDYEKRKSGGLLWSRCDNALIDPTDPTYARAITEDEELMDAIDNNRKTQWGDSYCRSEKQLLAFEEFNDWEFVEFETFSDSYDGVTAFGYYGYD